MKLWYLLLLLPLTGFSQSYHGNLHEAYAQALSQLSFCEGGISAVGGEIEVSESYANLVTITPPAYTFRCNDPFSVITYGPLLVNGENAVSYRVLYWPLGREHQPPTEYLTESNRATLPIALLTDYKVVVEAYDALGNSVFLEIN